MQDTEGKPIKLNGKPAEFTAKDFTATLDIAWKNYVGCRRSNY